MAYKNEYTTRELAKIRRMIEAGKSYQEIADKLPGRTRKGIAWCCRRYGMRSTAIPKNSKSYIETDLAKLRFMASEGFSQAAMARELGRSTGSISGTCSYYGIKTNGGPGGTPSHRVPMQTPILQPGQ